MEHFRTFMNSLFNDEIPEFNERAYWLGHENEETGFWIWELAKPGRFAESLRREREPIQRGNKVTLLKGSEDDFWVIDLATHRTIRAGKITLVPVPLNFRRTAWNIDFYAAVEMMGVPIAIEND